METKEEDVVAACTLLPMCLKIYSNVQGMYNLLEVWVVKEHKKAVFWIVLVLRLFTQKCTWFLITHAWFGWEAGSRNTGASDDFFLNR